MRKILIVLTLFSVFLNAETADQRDERAKAKLEEYKQKCANRDDLQCVFAGTAYLNGFSKPDYDNAIVYYKRACDLGNKNGCAGFESATNLRNRASSK